MKRALLVGLLVLGLVVLHGTPSHATDDVVGGEHSAAHVRTGTGGVLAADQPAAERIGNEILARGGDAIDAAVATALALGVENPSSSGLGGGGFAIVWRAKERRLFAVDFRERAPASANAVRYYTDGEPDTHKSQIGCLAAGVPGELAGLSAMHKRFGSLPWEDVVMPARDLALDGVAVTPYLAMASQVTGKVLEEFPEARAAYRRDGKPLRVGDLRTDPELGRLLERIATDGADVFYTGAVARQIEAACSGVPGAVTAQDLRDYRVRWRRPVVGRFKNMSVASMPPPSSGGAVLVEVLNVLSPQIADMDPGSPAYLHLLTESMKHAFSDRAVFFGDPDYVRVPVKRLTSAQYATQLRGLIDPLHTRPLDEYGAAGVDGTAVRIVGDDSGTTHLSVIDAEGNAVALTTSVNGLFGSFVRVPRVGIVLNNTMDDFALAPGVANAFGLIQSEANRIEPNKRPLSSMTPVIVLDDDENVVWVAGASGGPRIITGTLQVTLNALVHGMSAAEAVDAPRVHHQWRPNVVFAEDGISDAALRGLHTRGHETDAHSAIGNVQVVRRYPDGTLEGAADPRKDSH